jgi:imidazolonepropionase-like amidohydrolase
MKNLLFIALFFISISAAFAQADLIVKDANIITMTDKVIVEKKSIAVKNGKITQIDDFSKIKKDADTKILRAKGRFLMPGLADMHVHLPLASRIDTFLSWNIAAGVTQMRIMNGEMPQKDLQTKLLKNPNTISPNVHFSQLIQAEMKYSTAQFDSLIQSTKQQGFSFIKLFGIADDATFMNLMEAANKNKFLVCGHYPNKMPIETVLNSGFKGIEHLGGYGSIKDTAALAKAVQLTKAKNVFNCPTLDWDIMAYNLLYPNDFQSRLFYYNAPKGYAEQQELAYINSVKKEGVKEMMDLKTRYAPYFERKQQALKKLYEAGCPLLISGDVGSPLQLDGFNLYEEMVAWSKIGIDNFTILKSATVVPAQFLNQTADWGTIEIGKNADFIVLEKNPLLDISNIKTIKTTVINGKMYHKADILK